MEKTVKTKDFSFELPDDLIAQTPPEIRGTSRMMVLDPQTKGVTHTHVASLDQYLGSGVVMVFNDSKVRKARFFAHRTSGGRVEVIFLKPQADGSWEALVSKAKKLKVKDTLLFPGEKTAVITQKMDGGVVHLQWITPIGPEFFEEEGHIPLPPYIKREDAPEDWERYQNVFAQEIGSAAAPTAGLHFTQELLTRLERAGVEEHFITLHVGLGTFLPVRSEDLEDHQMHYEEFFLSESTAAALTQARLEGRRILAVGTTSLRTLEAAWDGSAFRSGQQRTNLFCTPGYQFQAVDALFTNFHTPESTLLALVCAFGGTDFVLEAYREAVKKRYRFFSYGDATLFLNHV
jgi:S-adenosylmethionine:tRNA ribosyltransferase-isomerase